MTEDTENKDVKNEESVNPPESNESQSQKASSPEVGSKEYNWRQMELKNRQLEEQLNELKNSINSNKKQEEPTTNKEEDELLSLEDDDLLTKKQAERLAELRAKKIIEEEFSKREKASLPEKTKAQFADFDQVVTTENIEKLIKEDPDLEYDIQVSKNPYARAYKAIKQSQFYNEMKKHSANKEKIEENQRKPISSNSLGKQSPLSTASDYMKGSPDLFTEMQKYRGGSI